MTDVLTAVGNRWDSEVATLLEASTEVRIARRCADLADLLATAAAGVGVAAVVAHDLRGLDLSAVAQLRSAGLHVVGLAAPGDEGSERRLRQLGIDSVVVAGCALADLEQALLEGAAGLSQRPGRVDGEDDLPDDPFAQTPSAQPAPPASSASRRWRRRGGRGDDHGAQPDGDHAEHPGGRDEAGPDDDAPHVPGRVLAVWGPTGAPGRTTIAVNVAAELAAFGIPTVLVDADTYGGSVAQALALLDEAPGLAAAARAADQGTLDLPALARLSPEASRNLRVITGIPKPERWTEIRPAALERVLVLARSLGDVVVVDCGFNLEDDEELSYDTQAPRRNAATLTTLSVADEMVAVGSADPVGLQRLVRGLQELGTVASPMPRVVVNRVRASAVGAHPETRVAQALARFAGIDEVVLIPDDPAALDGAMLEGRTLAECAPASPVRVALRALAAEVGRVPVAASRRGRWR